jgi:Histidine biosynthesis protein
VLIIPSIDLAGGRSRIVHWPGAAAGIGAPSDRPEVIAERFVAHGGTPDPGLVERLVHDLDVEVVIAGGVTDLAGIFRLRDAGVTGILLGEVLLSGRIEYPAAMEAAA